MNCLLFIDRRTLREHAKKALDLVDLPVSPATPVMRLPQDERQLVEIAKAVTRPSLSGTIRRSVGWLAGAL
jgi:ABC-type sugar transport system ATPase subunit